MVAVDREDRDSHVDVLILVVHMVESSGHGLAYARRNLLVLNTYGSKCSVGSLNSSSSQGLSP